MRGESSWLLVAGCSLRVVGENVVMISGWLVVSFSAVHDFGADALVGEDLKE